jgi:hypothetical protein
MVRYSMHWRLHAVPLLLSEFLQASLVAPVDQNKRCCPVFFKCWFKLSCDLLLLIRGHQQNLHLLVVFKQVVAPVRHGPRNSLGTR